MTEWNIFITYATKPYELKAVLEYQSNQVMRIRVYGKKESILLENNYPFIRLATGKKGIVWKIREGSLGAGTERNAHLLKDIMNELEVVLKRDFPKLR